MVSDVVHNETTQNRRRTVLMAARNKQPRVLVVEDDSTILSFISMALNLDGYKCVRASNGAEAVKRITEGVEPAIIILDLSMPVMDGKDFYRWLRGSGRTEVPVILMTAGQDGLKVCKELGAQACLSKPFELAELQGHIRKFLKAGAKN